MTRYARARGSKGANEKTPEEATPWHIMKQQAKELQDSARERHEETRPEKNWKKEVRMDEMSALNRNSVWADFADQSTDKKLKHASEVCSDMKQNLDLENFVSEGNISFGGEGSSVGEPIDERKGTNDNDMYENTQKSNSNICSTESGIESKKVKCEDEFSRETGYQCKKDKSRMKRFKKDRDPKPVKVVDKSWSKQKLRNEEHQRRKPAIQSFHINVNGRDVEIEMFQGFYIKKEDADRLYELKRKLEDKGVPKDQIDITLKGERRRAEKALAREKKKVCFKCRKFGHNLNDCPETQSGVVGSGQPFVCYKCGSTEHKAYQCRVVREVDRFNFATCFICGEAGHIAKQCPDNPRGLYPKGGACRLCGDVTHLKKDCPKAIAEKTDSKITLQTLEEGTSLEGLDSEVRESHGKIGDSQPKIMNKIINF